MEFCLNRGEELLNVSVDIGNGQRDTLRIHEHDDLQLVVRNFFIKNNITSEPEEAFLNQVNLFMLELVEEHTLFSQALAGMPFFTSPVCKNFGEKLYRKCMQDKEIKIVKDQNERISRAKKVQETLQDRPVIDKKSIKIIKNSIFKSVSTSKLPTESQSSNLSTSRVLKKFSGYIKRTPKHSQTNSTDFRSDSISPNIQKDNRKSQRFEEKDAEQVQSQALMKLTKHVKIDVDKNSGLKVFTPVHQRNPKKGPLKVVFHGKTRSQEDVENLPSPMIEKREDPAKKKKFSAFFDLLKDRESSKIDPENMNLDKVEGALKYIGPVVWEIMREKEKIGLEEFYIRMEKLFDGLSLEAQIHLMEDKNDWSLHPKRSAHKHSLSTCSFGSFNSRQNTSKRSDSNEKPKQVIYEDKKNMRKLRASPRNQRK